MALSGRKESKNLIVGLDIGTSKIVAIVAELKPEGGFEVIGMGSSPSRGSSADISESPMKLASRIVTVMPRPVMLTAMRRWARREPC